ncbi:MAG: hypothetical protein H6729_08050 [Deltaproteobacteria bacterium]|nr:hypothetical protein [Deltaproteobacteria bacterium]
MRWRGLVAMACVAASGAMCGVEEGWFPLFFNDGIVNVPSGDSPPRDDPARSQEEHGALSDIDRAHEVSAASCEPFFLFLEDANPLIRDFDEAMRQLDRPSSKGKLRGYIQDADGFANTVELDGFSDVWNDLSGSFDETLQVVTVVAPERLIAVDRRGRVLRELLLSGERQTLQITRLADGRYLMVGRMKDGGQWFPKFEVLSARWWEVDSRPSPISLPQVTEGEGLRFGFRLARRFEPKVQSKISLGWTLRGSDGVDRPRVAILDTSESSGPGFGVQLVELPEEIQRGLLHSLHEVPGGGLIVAWQQWSKTEEFSQDNRVSYYDGRSWQHLAGDLSGGLAPRFGLAVTPAGEVLAATVEESKGASSAEKKRKRSRYRLSLHSWDPWGRTWNLVTSAEGGGLSKTEKSYKSSPTMWLNGETLHLGWLEETAETGYSTSNIVYAMAHGERRLRRLTTHSRDFFAVRYGAGKWADMQTSRKKRKGLLGGELMMRYDFLAVDCL